MTSFQEAKSGVCLAWRDLKVDTMIRAPASDELTAPGSVVIDLEDGWSPKVPDPSSLQRFQKVLGLLHWDDSGCHELGGGVDDCKDGNSSGCCGTIPGLVDP